MTMMLMMLMRLKDGVTVSGWFMLLPRLPASSSHLISQTFLVVHIFFSQKIIYFLNEKKGKTD
jgi:hypothetical protein